MSNKDLIDEYVEYASNSCDAPMIYHKVLAYFIISSLIGRYARVVTSYAPGGIMPNIWVLIIGASRITRKTTAMNLAIDVIEAVDNNLIMPASFTPEALYEMLNGLNPGDAVAWVKDEMGGFFKMLTKKYMWGVREILSSIYMGQGEVRKLRNLTLRIPKGLYVTTAGTMPTPAHYYLTEEDFTSGFLNRFILAYATMREKRIPLLYRNESLTKVKEAIVEKLKGFVKFYSDIAPVPISFSHGAQKMLEDYDLEVERELYRIEKEQPTSLFKLYLAEAPKIYLKMAVLRRLAREPLSDTITVVDERDCMLALEDLKAVLKCAENVINEVQLSAQAKPVLTEEKALDRIYNIIKSKGSDGATLSEILATTHWLKKDVAEYLITLVEQGKIIAVKKKSFRGRRPICFYTTDYALYAKDQGDLIDAELLGVLLKR